MLSFYQKDLLQNLVTGLKPYCKLTDIVSGELEVTASSVPHLLCHLCYLAEDDPSISDSDNLLSELRSNIWRYVKER